MPGPRPKAKRLSGLNPLAYVGVEPSTPLQFLINDRAPTTSDYANHNIGDIWLYKIDSPTIDELWILVNKIGNQATWIPFGSDITANQFDTDSGSAEPLLGVIEILGGTNANTTGSGNTVTVNATTATDVATSYTTDAGSAVPAANVLTIAGGGNTSTSGAGSTVTVTATTATDVATTYDADTGPGATPAVNTITFAGGTNVTTSATGSTVTITATDTTGLTIAGDNLNEAPAGTVNLNETIRWPDTNVAGTTGVIYFGASGGVGGTRFIHKYGSGSCFMGIESGNFALSGTANTGFGDGTLEDLTTGFNNTGIGHDALTACTTGHRNVGLGNGACFRLTTGERNTGLGTAALDHITSGSYNIGIGEKGGENYTSTESSNIAISSPGLTGESNTIRLGSVGVGPAQQNRFFAAGIRGITTGVADAIPVLIDSAAQLGTVSSSIRYKQNVEDMGTESDDLLKLRPVIFEYKKHPSIKQYGLIAEEVQEVMPRLVVKDQEGNPETVKYHEMQPILLHAIQKLVARVDELEKKLLS